MKLIRYEYPQVSGTNSLDRLFDFWAPSSGRCRGLLDDFWNPAAGLNEPAIDLYEDDQHFYARMELPGVKKDAINLELENSVLTCSGSYAEESKQGKANYRFQRSISVPDGVALDQVSAHCEDGILTVQMPKKEASKPLQIKVK